MLRNFSFINHNGNARGFFAKLMFQQTQTVVFDLQSAYGICKLYSQLQWGNKDQELEPELCAASQNTSTPTTYKLFDDHKAEYILIEDFQLIL